MTHAESHARNIELNRRYKVGESLDILSAEFGLTPLTIRTVCSKLPGRRKNQSKDANITPRHIAMRDAYASGMTLEDVGAAHGVTRERVRQLIKKHFGFTRVNGGKSTARFLAAHDIIAKKKAAKDAVARRFFARWGVTREFARTISSAKLTSHAHPIRKYGSQVNNAKKRGIGWEFTFCSWWQMWQDSGKWELRGRGKGYCMARYGDSGPYSPDNVYICTIGENFSDSYIVHPAHERTAKRLATLAARV